MSCALYSVLTGICVSTGTIFFFGLFQKAGPLSAMPMILAIGAALMAIAGFLVFKEPVRLGGCAYIGTLGQWKHHETNMDDCWCC